ncbi:helix-turn-helix transcriptional regulator [Staphylococcus aureus]
MRYKKLHEFMKERGVTSIGLSSKLNIDRSTLYRKMNQVNGADFTCTEMRKICILLNISSDEFFRDL